MTELTDVLEQRLGGTRSMLGQKLNNLSQAEASDLLRRILEKISTSAEQHPGLADFGMCLMMGNFTTG